MAADIDRFITLWRAEQEAFTRELASGLAQNSSFYGGLAPEMLYTLTDRLVSTCIAALEQDKPELLQDYTREASLERASEQIALTELLNVVERLRAQIWSLLGRLYTAGDWDIDLVHQLEGLLHGASRMLASGYTSQLGEAWARLAQREEEVHAQSRIIQELSTPIVPIAEGVLVLPLVGAVDSRRATQVMEAALEQIVSHQAEVLILDITGVPVVDTGVANHLLQMARAVTLLGAQVILVGIGAEIAQTIVQLGLDLRSITTMANLQAGIAHALALRGLTIQPLETPARLG